MASFNIQEMLYRLFHSPASSAQGAAVSTAVANDAARGHNGATLAGEGSESLQRGANLGGEAVALVNHCAASSGLLSSDQRLFVGEERLIDTLHAPRRYPLDPGKDAELLVLLAQQYSITSVVITHYRVKDNYVEYVIECTRGYDAWRVYRRYQQFKSLDHDLKQLCGGRQGACHGPYGVVPVLPGSHWMDVTNQSPEMVEQRRRYLEIYLQQLLVAKNLFYVARTALYDFLHNGEVPTHMKLTGIQPLLGLISTRTDCFSDDDDAGDPNTAANAQKEQAQAGRVNDSPSSAELLPPGGSKRTDEGGSGKEEAPVTRSGHTVRVATPEGRDGATPSVGLPTTSMLPNEPRPPAENANLIAATATTAAPLHAIEVCKDKVAHVQSAVERKPSLAREPNRPAKTTVDKPAGGGLIPLMVTSPMKLSSRDERLPPLSTHCAQCNAEFNSFLYPFRCFFCRVQFCTSCLQKIPLLERSLTVSAAPPSLHSNAIISKEESRNPPWTNPTSPVGTGRTVPACRQCAENYTRRLDRCGTAPGGGAYSGMQSTLHALTPQEGTLAADGRSLASSAAAPSSPIMSSCHCIGEENNGLMLPRGTSVSGSSFPHGSPLMPSGSFASRSALASPVGLENFQLLTVIGRGTFGKVLKVRMRSSRGVYAIKIMNKATVYRRCMASYMKEEKSILTNMRPHPYIVRCHYAFQTDYYLVFVMDYLPGGELYDYLYPKLRLPAEAARIYAAELVLALECLHRQDIVHRDLKPENVVLAADGHICLTDFGLARRAFSRSRRRSFVGSPEYVAPETIQGQVQTAAVDWWSFGVMLYEMLAGKTPFHARNNNTVYDNVLHKELVIPVNSTAENVGIDAPPVESMCPNRDGATRSSAFSPEAASLLRELLVRDPSERLQDAKAIKAHPYFRGLNWDDLQRRLVPAPCIPGDVRDNDVRHFKREFVSEWASVPPLTDVTRTSIEMLTKCFDNFPVSRAAPPTSTVRQEKDKAHSSPVSSSPSSPLSQPPQRMHNAAPPLPSSLSLPLSAISSNDGIVGEAVRFHHSLPEAHRAFEGMWRVLSVEVHAANDGRVIYPWGGEVVGLLVYGTRGRFSLQLSSSTRRPMGPVQRVAQLTKQDLCDTYCSYVASFGSFRLVPSSADDGGGVVHHLSEGNLCPNLASTNTVFQYRVHSEPRKYPPPSSLMNTGEAVGWNGEQESGNTSASTASAAPLDPTKSIELAANEKVNRFPSGPHRVDPCSAPAAGEIGVANGGTAASMRAVNDCGQANASTNSVAVDESPSLVDRRLVLRLSTRPQKVLEQNFFAYTCLVFEKLP